VFWTHGLPSYLLYEILSVYSPALFDRAELYGGPGGFPVYGKVVLII